jgi:hypothetical protein
MLAEIFLIRLEAISRASKESAPANNSRFVPITLPDKKETFENCLELHAIHDASSRGAGRAKAA